MNNIKKCILVLIIGVLMVACSPSGESTKDEPQETEVNVEKSADVEYAVILKTQASDFWVKMKDGILEKADELGVKVDVYAAQSEEDTEGQLKILENCINGNYKAIGIAPLSPVNLIPGIVQATEKGIYVMDIDEKVDIEQLMSQGGSVIAFATTDNVSVGQKGAEFIVKEIQKGDKVAIIEGKAGNKSGEDRKNGAYEAFEKAGLEIVGSLPADWDRQKALDVASSFIQQHPGLKGIYACNDGMALGAVQAVINSNKLDDIIVVGTDGDREAVDSIDRGELTATVAQDPAGIGAASLEEMVNAVKNKLEIEKDKEPKTIPIDSNIISK